MIKRILNWIYGVRHPNPNVGNFFVASHGDKKIKYKCGHRGSTNFQLLGFGEVFWNSADAVGKNSIQKEICAECWLHYLKELIIQCFMCGKPILPGQAIIVGCIKKVHLKKGARDTLVADAEGAKICCCRCNPLAIHFCTHTWDGIKAVPMNKSDNSGPVKCSLLRNRC